MERTFTLITKPAARQPISRNIPETAISMQLLIIGSYTFFEQLNSQLKIEHIFHAENIHQARKQLLHAEAMPDAIICDMNVDRMAVHHLTTFLSLNKPTAAIPFLLVTEKDSTAERILASKHKGIDDIIYINTTQKALESKISILKKYKEIQSKLPYTVQAKNGFEFDGQTFFRRLIDIVISSVLLLLALPLMLIIAICIKLESKGPIFYRSLRAGSGYKVFTFFKFRTMVENAEDMVTQLEFLNEYKPVTATASRFFKIKGDPRVTRVGRILRNLSLDELPQLINVLKGDMCLVGNRPLPLYEARSITMDNSAKRFLAPAGITGLWQVKGRSNLNLSVEERIQMDVDYATKHSLLFDMKILLKTPRELIHKHDV